MEIIAEIEKNVGAFYYDFLELILNRTPPHANPELLNCYSDQCAQNTAHMWDKVRSD